MNWGRGGGWVRDTNIQFSSGQLLKISQLAHIKNIFTQELPGGPMVRNPPANTGDMAWFLVQHAAEQLSLWAATAELMDHSYCSPCTESLGSAAKEKPRQWEAHAPCRIPTPGNCDKPASSKEDPAQP